MTTTTTTTQRQTTQRQTTQINGATELKQAIQEYTAIMREMKQRFDDDITQSDLATFEPNPICRPLHDFHVRSCAVTHSDFIRKMRQCDELIGAEKNITETLTALEKLRKMMVTNKQQRKTEHKSNRRVAIQIMSFQDPFNTELEPEPITTSSDLMTESTLTLKQMDANAKQHHRTVARNLLVEVNRLFAQLRAQFIVAYQAAVDTIVGKVIHHAEKCRGFNDRTLRLAVIEFCASRWFHANKDAMDQTEYNLSAVKDESITSSISRTTDDVIQIKIHALPESILVGMFQFDEAISNDIITEEAIQAFEWEQQSLWFDRQAAREKHAKYEQEYAKFYEDQAMAAADAASTACTVMGDSDSESYDYVEW